MYLSRFAIVCLLGFSLLGSCVSGPKNKRVDEDKVLLYLSSLSDSIGVNPLSVCASVDSVLPTLSDSSDYFLSLILKSKALMMMSKPDSAASLLHRVSGYTHRQSGELRQKDYRLRMELANMEGNLFARQSQTDSAINAFRLAFENSLYAGEAPKRLDICLNLADAYVRYGRFDLGSMWYRRSLSLADTLGLPEEKRFPIYYGLAQVNMELRDFATCDYYYDRAAQSYDKMMLFEKHIYLNNRGNSYYYRQDYATALKYFRKLFALVSSYKDMEFEQNLTMVNLGEVFLLLGQTDSASYYLNRCQPFFKRTNNETALYYIDTQLIELALKENNVPLARKRLAEAVRPTYVDPNMVHIRNRYLQHYFEEEGDYKKAYHYQMANARMDDSIRSERVKMRTAEIVQRYRQDSTLMKKEMIIAEKQNELLVLNQYIYIAVFAVLLLGAVLFVWFLINKRKQEEKVWNMRAAFVSQKLENIRNRISPHFIFNVLNREISRPSAEEEERKESLMDLVKLMRRNLELTDRLAVLLRDEIDFVETYINLEAEALQPGFEYKLDISKEIDVNKVEVPAMLLQIPVENAIKHALRMKEGERRLWVSVTLQSDGSFLLTVCDNGGGYRPSSSNRGTGTGMKVITQTIQLLNLYNDSSVVMTVNNVDTLSGEKGCEVRYVIPAGYVYDLKKMRHKI